MFCNVKKCRQKWPLFARLSSFTMLFWQKIWKWITCSFKSNPHFLLTEAQYLAKQGSAGFLAKINGWRLLIDSDQESQKCKRHDVKRTRRFHLEVFWEFHRVRFFRGLSNTQLRKKLTISFYYEKYHDKENWCGGVIRYDVEVLWNTRDGSDRRLYRFLFRFRNFGSNRNKKMSIFFVMFPRFFGSSRFWLFCLFLTFLFIDNFENL